MIRKMYRAVRRQSGFTLLELLIVILVIGILAAIVSVTYIGIQSRVENLRRQNDLNTVETMLEVYAAKHRGSYPATTDNPVANWKTVDVRTDDNCFNGTSQEDWVPGFTRLPQSHPNTGQNAGVNGNPGCYLYASNGVYYVLSAWNMLGTPMTEKPYYRRLGFRSFQTSTSTQFYTCNENVIGGANGQDYDIDSDYYKHSFTLSNIEECDETPPPGA